MCQLFVNINIAAAAAAAAAAAQLDDGRDCSSVPLTPLNVGGGEVIDGLNRIDDSKRQVLLKESTKMKEDSDRMCLERSANKNKLEESVDEMKNELESVRKSLGESSKDPTQKSSSFISDVTLFR